MEERKGLCYLQPDISKACVALKPVSQLGRMPASTLGMKIRELRLALLTLLKSLPIVTVDRDLMIVLKTTKMVIMKIQRHFFFEIE